MKRKTDFPNANSFSSGRRSAIKKIVAGSVAGISVSGAPFEGFREGTDQSYYTQAWDSRFAGTGFRPENTPEQNRLALDALWNYLDESTERVRAVDFLPGDHNLLGSFSPSGRNITANRRGGQDMVFHFQGTAIKFSGEMKDFNQMRIMHEGDGKWHALNEYDAAENKLYLGAWGNQGEVSTIMESPKRLKKFGVAFDVRSCGDIKMYGALEITGPGNGQNSPATALPVVGMGASGGHGSGHTSGMMRGSFAGKLSIKQFMIGMGAFTVWGISGSGGAISGSGQADVWTNSAFDQLAIDNCVHGIICDNNHFDMMHIGHLRHLCRFPSYLLACHGTSIGGGSFIHQNSNIQYPRNEKVFELYNSSLFIGNFYGRTPGRDRNTIVNHAYTLFNVGNGASLKFGCFHSDMTDTYASKCFVTMAETDSGMPCNRAMFSVDVVDKVTDRSPNDAILGIVPFPGAKRHAHVVAFGEGESGCAAVKVIPKRDGTVINADTEDYLDVYSERHSGRKIFNIKGGKLTERGVLG